MLTASWPLWVEPSEIPRVPFLDAVPQSPAWPSRVLFGGLLLSTAATVVRPRRPLGVVVTLGLSVGLILQDQHRFQPWLYQYLLLGLFLTALRPGVGLQYARWTLVSLYVHSGLSKLDRPFCDELGPVFLRTAARLLGADASAWSPSWMLVLAMPTAEVLTGLLLLGRRSRRLGLLGASLMHLSLIGILGPFGLRHSGIVLGWNLLMLVELWIAFGAACAVSPGPGPDAWRERAVKAFFWATALFPLGERLGIADAWPSYALYSSHVERSSVFLHESEIDHYPESVRRQVRAENGFVWSRLDLTSWSRSVRGTPLYPQNRAALGIAEGLASRFNAHGLVKVDLWSAGGMWSGRRTRREVIGLEAIRREGSRSRLNAHPAREP